MTGLLIRGYRPADRAALLALAAAALPAEPMPAERLDALAGAAGPDGLLLGWAAAELAGFVLASAGAGGDGWLTALGVAPGFRGHGHGRALVAAAIARLRDAGCRQVRTGGPGEAYLVPGVDPAAYPAAARLLDAAGFRETGSAQGMARDLSRPIPPPRSTPGICYRPPAPAELPALTAMIAGQLSPSWAALVAQAAPERLLVAFSGPAPVGFAASDVYAGCPGRFGPTGVAGDYRGQGIGRGLLDRTLLIMRAGGHPRAWFLWGPEGAAGQAMYRSAGFVADRTFRLLSLDLVD